MKSFRVIPGFLAVAVWPGFPFAAHAQPGTAGSLCVDLRVTSSLADPSARRNHETLVGFARFRS
jgi:hypothetical protein